MNKLKITAYMCLLSAVFSMISLSGCAGSSRMYLEAKEQKAAPDTQGYSADVQETAEEQPEEASGQTTCFVYVCGAVKSPGVFEVPAGSRVYEVIALAGGFKKNASVKGLNQARQVADGDMLEILTEEEQREAEQEADGLDPGAGNEPDGRIDINTASAAELMTLSGIGEAKAAAIIAYRTENGRFSASEELMKVSGIGEGVYAQIKDKITVEK